MSSVAALAAEDDMIDFCFPALAETKDCASSKILAVRNTMVDAYNQRVLMKLVATYRWPSYHKCSADSMDMDGDNCIEPYITTEFMNMQNHAGVPPHSLHLVEGALYELTRNISSADRLMNHTPVIVRRVHAHHVTIETMSGQTFPLPRICFRFPSLFVLHV